MTRKITGLSLIGGAGLGALVMYLLDPEVGDRRRQKISSATSDALHDAGQALSHAVQEISEKAGDIRQKIHDRAQDLSAQAGDQFDSVHGQAHSSVTNLSERLRDQAHRLKDAISQRAADSANSAGVSGYAATARKYVDRARSHLHMNHRRSGISATGAGLSAGGALAIGVTAMFLLDPAQGRQRRRALGKSVSQAVSAAGSTCNTAGHFIRGQWDRMFSAEDETAPTAPRQDRWQDEHREFPPATNPPVPSTSAQ